MKRASTWAPSSAKLRLLLFRCGTTTILSSRSTLGSDITICEDHPN
jgi:hypothetical protein